MKRSNDQPAAVIVDAHAHLFTRRPSAWRPPPAGQPSAALAEDFLAVMDGAGVARAILIGIKPNEGYLRQCVLQHPERFAAIDVHEPAAGPEQVARSAAHGFRGIRVFEVLPLETLRAIRDHGLVLWLFPRSDQLDHWFDILARLPDLPVVLNHLGRCSDVDRGGRRQFTERIWRIADLPNTFAMVSNLYEFSGNPFPYLDLVDAMTTIHQRFGPDRMLWASNYPLVLKDPAGYAAQLEVPAHHLPDLTSQARAAILGGTAQLLIWK